MEIIQSAIEAAIVADTLTGSRKPSSPSSMMKNSMAQLHTAMVGMVFTDGSTNAPAASFESKKYLKIYLEKMSARSD